MVRAFLAVWNHPQHWEAFYILGFVHKNPLESPNHCDSPKHTVTIHTQARAHTHTHTHSFTFPPTPVSLFLYLFFGSFFLCISHGPGSLLEPSRARWGWRRRINYSWLRKSWHPQETGGRSICLLRTYFVMIDGRTRVRPPECDWLVLQPASCVT